MKKKMSNRILSMVLSLAMVISTLSGCGSATENQPEIDIEETSEGDTISETNDDSKTDTNEVLDDYVDTSDLGYFIYQKFIDEYSLVYNTFNAAVTLEDGTQIAGIGYSDFSNYLEAGDGSYGYFPAGFIPASGEVSVPQDEIDNGIEICNLDYVDDSYGFVYAIGVDSYYEHLVVGGQYVKYGVSEEGVFEYTAQDYSREICDTDLGALYSIDDNKYLYDTNVGEYVYITGDSLSESIDYDALQAEVNRILEEQDFNFSTADIETTAYFAQEAINSYLLSLQEETFLGQDVEKLVEEVGALDPTECIRITPDGNVTVDLTGDVPSDSKELARWLVGAGCVIAIAGSVALEIFVPAATPASGAIIGASIDVFMQVVIENNSVENINWTKVAISATSGAIMAWACPLGASAIAENVATSTGSKVAAKLAGYGFQTFGNSVVSGATNAAFKIVDDGSDEEVMDAFLMGAAVGACCTVAASVLSEGAQAGMKALEESHPENWLTKLSQSSSKFIGEHQVHLKNSDVEAVLAPKSVYEATEAGIRQYNQQMALSTGTQGGPYNEVRKNNFRETEAHETPSFSSTGGENRNSNNGPSIKMTKADHKQTASYGSSNAAKEYREAQQALIDQGKYHDAIQMDIDDITSKMADGTITNDYTDAINEMIKYATEIGWW